jgi:cytosine/adenosine deaminase-related metal-dependent hydrolase
MGKPAMPRRIIHARAIADYRGVLASPGAIVMEGRRILEIGTPQTVGSAGDTTPLEVPGFVLPPLVNAHAHLDLSGVGPQPAAASLSAWIEDVVLPIRRRGDDAAAIARGIDMALAGGTAFIGDIAASDLAVELVQQSPLRGVSFRECIGSGDQGAAVIAHMPRMPGGLQPHALYSCDRDVFEAALASGRPLSTHLAETPEEVEFTMSGGGAMAAWLESLPGFEPLRTWGGHPIDVLLDMLGDRPLLAAHCNHVEERHIDRLASSGITVAYCPRASAYFGHDNHRWRDMLDAGVPVAFGTDSLLCLDTPHRISVLDEMRYLWQRHKASAADLLTMATTHGAAALGVDRSLVTLEPGEIAGLLAVSGGTWEQAMGSNEPPKWILRPQNGETGETGS